MRSQKEAVLEEVSDYQWKRSDSTNIVLYSSAGTLLLPRGVLVAFPEEAGPLPLQVPIRVSESYFFQAVCHKDSEGEAGPLIILGVWYLTRRTP